MTDDDHLGSRRAKAKLQRTSKFAEAVKKDDVIWRFARKSAIIERLENHTFLKNRKPSCSSPKFMVFSFFFPSLHPHIILFRYFSKILKCSLFSQICALTPVRHCAFLRWCPRQSILLGDWPQSSLVLSCFPWPLIWSRLGVSPLCSHSTCPIIYPKKP